MPARRQPARTARTRQIDWYETPRYYDIIFDVDTAREADFLEAVHARHAAPERRRGRRVLEPACGTGRLVLELARRGWQVTGFDASEPMLDFTRGRLGRARRKARLLQARMESFELRGPFDLAHCFVSTFKYLLDEAGARAHLERVASSLAPGGLYVLGLHLSEYDDTGTTRERWSAARGATQVVCNITGWPADRRTRREKVRSRLRIVDAEGERRTETTWEFRTYDARQLRRTIRSVPAFELVATYDFEYDVDRPSALDGEQLDTVLVLRRRA